MTRLLDLDKVLPADITVELRGQQYTLPGDPPLETYFKLLAIQEQAESDAGDEDTDAQRDLLQTIFDVTYELFAVHQPELDPAEFRKVIGVHSATTVLNQVVSMYSDAEESPNGDRPTRAQRRQKPPSSGARRKASRS